jgi:hypothetical protein
LKRIIFLLPVIILLFVSCKPRTKQAEHLKPADEIHEDESIEKFAYFDIPENSSFKGVIANFHKYRDPKRMYEGLEEYDSDGNFIGDFNFAALLHSDTLLIFNFDKGTVKGILRGEGRYINYIKGFPIDKTITGDFNGDGKIETMEMDWESINKKIEKGEISYSEIEDFDFIFSDKKIPKLNVWGNSDYTIKNEGDLDGDGADEIGFLYGWATSACRTYTVFTLKNNKWEKLIEGVQLTHDMRAAGIVPVEKDLEQEGVILVRSVSHDNPFCHSTDYVLEQSVKIEDLKYRRQSDM